MTSKLTKISIMSFLFSAIFPLNGWAMEGSPDPENETTFSQAVRSDKLESFLGKGKFEPISQNIFARAPKSTTWARNHLIELGIQKPSNNEVREGVRQFLMEEALEESAVWAKIGTKESVQEGLRQIKQGNPDPRNAEILEGLRQQNMDPPITAPSYAQIQAGLMLIYVLGNNSPDAVAIIRQVDQGEEDY